MNFDNYILGLMYGDGHFVPSKNGCYMFSSTHKEIADKVEKALKENKVHFSRFQREHIREDNKNWEVLEIIEVYDKKLVEHMKWISSDEVKDRVKFNGDYIRGLLETSGTLFSFSDKGKLSWRVSFSGAKEDMEYLKELLENNLNISMHKVVRRREREEKGIISNSYRLNMQSRSSIATFLDFIKGDNTSEYLRDKIERFDEWNANTPFNMKTKIFKNYKGATLYMARQLNIEVKGERKGGGKKGWKPVYLWEGEQKLKMYEGWTDAYKKICELYKSNTNFDCPKVEEEIK